MLFHVSQYILKVSVISIGKNLISKERQFQTLCKRTLCTNVERVVNALILGVIIV